MNQLSAGSHVTPLFVTTQLETNTILLILIEEVVALKQLISELRDVYKRQVLLGPLYILYNIIKNHILWPKILLKN